MNSLASFGLFTGQGVGCGTLQPFLCIKEKERDWEKKKKRKKESKKKKACTSSALPVSRREYFFPPFSHYNNGFTAPEKGPGASANGA